MRLLGCWSALLVVLACAVGLCGEPEPLPADVVLLLEFRNVEQILTDVQTFAETAQPGMTTEFVKMGFEQMVMSGDFAGLRADGVFKMLLLDVRKYPRPVVIVVPLLDAEIYRDAVAQRLKGKAPAERDGLTVFGEDAAFLGVGKDKKLAALADDASACKLAVGLIDAGKLQDGPMVGLDGAFAVRADPGKLLESYKDAIAASVESLQKQMEAAFGAQPAPQGLKPEQIAAMYKLEIEAAIGIAMQLRSYELAVTISLDGVTVLNSIEAQPDSTLAQFLAKQPPNDHAALKLLPPEAIAVADVPVAGYDVISGPYMELVKKLLAVLQPERPEDDLPQEVQELMGELLGLLKGEYAIAWVQCPTDKFALDMVGAIRVSDVARARELSKTYPELLQKWGDLYRGLGAKTEVRPHEGKQEHRGVELVGCAYKYTMPLADAQPEAIKKLFGEGMDIYIAIVDDWRFFTMGKNAKSQMIAVIDRYRDGGGSLWSSQELQDSLKASAVDVREPMGLVFWSTGEFCRWMGASDTPGHEFYAAVQGGPGMSISFGRDGARWSAKMVLPMREVLAIGRAITAMGEAMIEQFNARRAKKPAPQLAPEK